MSTPDQAHHDDTLGEIEFLNRSLPAKEQPFEAFAALLAAVGMVFGLAALFTTPMKPGFAGIGLAIIALAIAGDRNRIERVALLVSSTACFIGALLAVLRNTAFW
jgi:hypothetical protein